MKNNMKNNYLFAILLTLTLACVQPITTYAGTITASGVSTVCVQTNYKYYATGYTTSKSRHYTNVRLMNGAIGCICAESGRKWGKNKVTATTPTIDTFLACNNYYGKVYYGF